MDRGTTVRLALIPVAVTLLGFALANKGEPMVAAWLGLGSVAVLGILLLAMVVRSLYNRWLDHKYKNTGPVAIRGNPKS